MQFKLLVITFTLALATGLMAAPLTTPNTTVTSGPANGYIELYREEASTSDGYLIYYGPGGSDTNMRRSELGSLEERATCPTTGSLSCSSSHAARNDVCDTIVTELQTDYNVPVSLSPRQICYLGTSESNLYCCVSWHNPIPGLIKGDLWDIATNSKQPLLVLITRHAQKAEHSLLLLVFTQCTQDGISGKTYNVFVNGVCTSVCLSDRGTNC
jgi:hypothetical protein